MPEDQDNDEPKTAKRKKKCVWLGIIVVLTLIIICSLRFLPNSKSADEQLAEIETARAIPDSENAAIIYNELLQDHNAASWKNARPEFLDDEAFFKTGWEPWLSEDYPELAAWLETRQDTIERLFEACAFEGCRFPIVIDPWAMPGQTNPLIAIYKWAYLLRFAANNDIAEGRTDDAIAKWRCLVRMSEHFRQQPSHIYYLTGIGIGFIALQLPAIYIVEGDAVEMRLRQIESIPLDTKDNWAAHAEQIRIIEKLTVEKLKEGFSPIEHVKYLFNYGIYGIVKLTDLDDSHMRHLRHIASRRGCHILIALRRYKNKHGHWPKSLDQIRPNILPEALIDPFNDDPFIYRLTDTGFELYSTGKNKIDDNGNPRNPFDDWPIWPPPARKNKTSKETANTQPPDPNANRRE